MSISYPVNLPNVGGIKGLRYITRDGGGFSESPFSYAQQAFQGPASWAAVLSLVPMERAEAAAWVAWRKSLYGAYGYFLMGDPLYTTQRGTWAALAPKVNGAHLAGATTLRLRDVPDGTTWLGMDHFQLGSGSSARLHMVTVDGSMLGSPSEGYVELWPPLRDDAADGAAVTLASPKGLWRLAPGNAEWSLDPDAGFILPDIAVMEKL